MIRPTDYHLPGGKTGVLLIHGLTGTPAEMRFVAKGLNRAGFTVAGMQLAGHCGDEADLLRTGWRDWYRSVDEAASKLLKEVDHLFVGGLSMGAVLALKLAIERPQDVRGVALYGTTFHYDGWAIPSVARFSFLLPLICALGFGRGRSFQETHPYGIRDERVRNYVAGNMFAGDSGAAGLRGNPWPSLAQFYRLASRVKRNLQHVRAPCLAIHAAEDDVASVRNLELVRRRVAAPFETLLLHDSYHMITVDKERATVAQRTAEFFGGIAACA
ncbi:MAG: alpha/beta fold hydrolase [Betaproteobacteria bacterium]|nr:alpha/beta fold hydrolase [Betaproteobacteria bacterium]